MCKSKVKKPPGKQSTQQSSWKVGLIEEEELNEYTLCHVDSFKRTKPLNVDLEVDGKLISMELDTGAAYSLVSEATFKEFWPSSKKGFQLSRIHIMHFFPV